MQWKIEPFSSIHQPIFSKHFHTYSFYNCLFTLHFHSTVEWKKRVHSKSYLEQDLSRTVPIRLFVYYLLCTKLSRNVIRSLSLLPKKKKSIRNSCSNLQMKTINLQDFIIKLIQTTISRFVWFSISSCCFSCPPKRVFACLNCKAWIVNMNVYSSLALNTPFHLLLGQIRLKPGSTFWGRGEHWTF